MPTGTNDEVGIMTNPVVPTPGVVAPRPGTVCAGAGTTATVAGQGPPVLVVHGVGFGPDTFDALTAQLVGVATVATVHRPGYALAGQTPVGDLAAQVSDLAELCGVVGDADPQRRAPVVVGVSGGATLSLRMAISHPGVAAAVVLHEPLLGPCAPLLNTAVTTAAATLAGDTDPTATTRFLAALVGADTWQRWGHLATGVSQRTIRTEVAGFAAMTCTPGELADLATGGLAVHTTVGADSGPPRHQAAAVLADHAGAHRHTLAATGHLAHLDDPGALAAVVASVVGTTVARP
jgi:pimeloyl-ACP methyl ester carboxylesterase